MMVPKVIPCFYEILFNRTVFTVSLYTPSFLAPKETREISALLASYSYLSQLLNTLLNMSLKESFFQTRTEITGRATARAAMVCFCDHFEFLLRFMTRSGGRKFSFPST